MRADGLDSNGWWTFLSLIGAASNTHIIGEMNNNSSSSILVDDTPPQPDNASSAPEGWISGIHFLGTSSAVPVPGLRNTSAMAFTLSNGDVVLCDAGEAVQVCVCSV
jgi:hypothetical protein